MMLYVNGDSHSAGAEAVNTFAFAEDDGLYYALGRRPHPENLAVSWGMRLSKLMGLGFKCDAISGASNDRIIRTTNEFLDHRRSIGDPYTVIAIGWSTWEREEWWDEEERELIQISAGINDIKPALLDRYRKWVAGLDYRAKEAESHEKIHELHEKLRDLGIPHLFFNAMWHFSPMQAQKEWHGSYVDPYDPEMSYAEWAVRNGFGTDRLQHFGPEAHRSWADLLFNRLTDQLANV